MGELTKTEKTELMNCLLDMGQLLLKGDVQGFAQYLPMVQQHGGYQRMPLGYQDVVLCIQRQGNVPDSPYAAYVKRMSAGRRNNGQ